MSLVLPSTSEASLQVFSGAIPKSLFPDTCNRKLDSSFLSRSHVRRRKRRVSVYMQLLNCSMVLQNHPKISTVHGIGHVSHGNIVFSQSMSVNCQCQRTESTGELTAKDGNVNWLLDAVQKPNPLNSVMNVPNVLEFEEVQQSKHESESSGSNGKLASVEKVKDSLHKVGIDSLEDEAWNLLRESVVYYCGSPIGTIAAKDPTDSNVLNYDQVFIRDFIPSGIAFLLKGEYDIVRNFILHTLQLQVNYPTKILFTSGSFSV
uniref:Alkaline/neutral invertase n=1 Tax=Nelumbo nucifera TaxID=4432 RepID=A0A822Y919_NELNU|nr:TPA_asm: hypothetical protein HUJ06_030230 [Nelumbo nucifera]